MMKRVIVSGAVALCWLSAVAESVTLRADDAPPDRPRVVTPAASRGVRPYGAGTWGIVTVELRNPLDRDVKVLVSSSLKGTPQDQHARRFWIPAHSTRRSWQHIYFPKTLKSTATSADVETTAWDVTQEPRTLLKPPSGKRHQSSLLPVSSGLSATAVIANVPHDDVDRDEAASEEAVNACVFVRFRDQRQAILERHALPPTVTALDGLRHFVLYNDLIANDAAAMTAVRRWLQNGGRLWIMVDRVRQETVEKLLGDVAPYQIVDRVGLTQTRIQSPDKERWDEDEQPREFEQPVPLVRVLTTGVDVTHTVNGWPASFRQRCGKGRILYTTLGMRAWLRKTTANEKRQFKTDVKFHPREPLARITADLFANDSPPELRTEPFESYLTQQIGYEIVDRNVVVFVLAAFCAGLLLTAVWLRRMKKLERMRWIGPGWAVAAAALLTGMGAHSRRAVPETVVVAQIVQAAENSEEVTVSGRIAVYRQDGSKSTVGMSHGGVLEPEFVESSGNARRTLWTDLDRWEWANLDVPAGVQQSPFRYATNVGRPLRVVGHFGPNGLTGTLDTGVFREPADAVVTTSTGMAVGARLGDGNQFVSGPEQTLPPGVFITAGLLSDEQRRRQDVYRGLWKTKGNVPVVDRPTMLVWTQPIDMGLFIHADGHLEGDQRRAGSALLSIPIRLEKSPPATRVRIPAAFLSFKRILDPDGRTFSPAFHPSTREWVERSGPSRTWLRFQLPAEVRPVALDRATVTLHFDGPSRKLNLAGVVNGKVVMLANVDKPAGQVRIPVTRADALRLDPEGGLVLGIVVGEGEQPAASGSATSQRAFWRIQYVFVDVEGTTANK